MTAKAGSTRSAKATDAINAVREDLLWPMVAERIHGGVWQDYFELHSWFDASKSLLWRFTHRALRHHLEGVAEATAHFGADIRNSDAVDVDTMTFGVQYLEEGCPRIVSACDWLIGFEAPVRIP